MVKIQYESPEGASVRIGTDLTVAYNTLEVAGQAQHGIVYVWLTMPDGRTLSLFVNRERGLVVADIGEKSGDCGTEFVRRTIPPPLTPSEKRRIARWNSIEEAS